MKTHSKPICKSHELHSKQNLQIHLLLQPTLTICLILLSSFLFYFKSFSAGIPSDSSSMDTVLLSEVEIINDIYLFKGIPFSGVAISYYDIKVRTYKDGKPLPQQIISLKDGKRNGLSKKFVHPCYRNGGRWCLEQSNFINDTLEWIEVDFVLLEVKNFDSWIHWEEPVDLPDSISFFYENKPYTGKGVLFNYENKKIQTTAEFKNGKLYGVMEGRNILGNLKFKVEYKDGIKNGKELHFGREGVILSNSNYKNGKLDSLYESFNQNGQIITTGMYRYGKKEGIWTFFYPNGQLKWTHEYKNDKLNGICSSWFENGIKQYETHYENGNLRDSSVIWYSSGQKKEITYYVKGKKTGKYFAWYENGQLKEESQYLNDHRNNFIHWYETGPKKDEYNCNDSAAFCRYVSWHLNEKKEKEGRMKITYYRNIDDYYESLKDGLWTYFDPTGDTDKVENWKSGMLYSTSHYDSEGKNILYTEENQNHCLAENKKINEIFKEKGRIFSDQSALNPEFLNFKNKLIKSLKQKNKKVFLQLLADTIYINQSDQYLGPKENIVEIDYIMDVVNSIISFGFKKISSDEYSTFPFLDEVANIDLMNCCPIIVIDSNVSVMETPSDKGKIAGKIYLGCSSSLDPIPSTHESKDDGTNWYQVFFPDGLAGYVNSKHCLTFADYGSGVIVKKTKSGWRITMISIHPGC